MARAWRPRPHPQLLQEPLKCCQRQRPAKCGRGKGTPPQSVKAKENLCSALDKFLFSLSLHTTVKSYHKPQNPSRGELVQRNSLCTSSLSLFLSFNQEKTLQKKFENPPKNPPFFTVDRPSSRATCEERPRHHPPATRINLSRLSIAARAPLCCL